jgi:hypothetical protein
LLTEESSWRATFVTLALWGGVLFIFAYQRFPETKPSQGGPLPSWQEIATKMRVDPTIWTFSALVALSNGIIFSYWGEAPFLFKEQLHLSSTYYGLIGLWIAFCATFSSLLCALFNRLLQPTGCIALGIALATSGSVSFFLLAWIKAPQPLPLPLTLLAVGATFFGLGLVIPNCLGLALVNYRQMAGSAGAIFGFIYCSMVAVLTLGMSWLHSYTPLALPLYFSLQALAMALLFRRWTACKIELDL